MAFKFLLCGGDVGGARVLMPIAEIITESGHECSVVRHGHIAIEGKTSGFQWVEPPDRVDKCSIESLLESLNIDVYIFTTSVKDGLALEIARHAQIVNVPVVHVLDNWTSYKQRLVNVDGSVLHPEIYAVLDATARDEVVAAGFSTDSVAIVGSPALSNVSRMPKWEKQCTDETRLLFVSEPVDRDQGIDLSAPTSRGYTQYSVLKELIGALKQVQIPVNICLLPHPRENAGELERFWSEHRGEISGGVICPTDKYEAFFDISGVVGMSSILLYEAWLRGYPVLSLQPGLKIDALRMLGKKQGLLFLENQADLVLKISNWYGILNNYVPSKDTMLELEGHRNSAKTLLSEIIEMLESNEYMDFRTN